MATSLGRWGHAKVAQVLISLRPDHAYLTWNADRKSACKEGLDVPTGKEVSTDLCVRHRAALISFNLNQLGEAGLGYLSHSRA